MQIYPDKTENMLVGATTTLEKFKNTQSLGVAGSIKKVQDVVKIVCVSLNSTLSIGSHISTMRQSCHYHMRAPRTQTYLFNANSRFGKLICL